MSYVEPEKSAARRAQVAAMTAQGKSAAAIAAILRTTERTVVRDRQHLGIAKPASTAMTPEDVQRAQDMLDDGATCAEVARTLGRSDSTILRRFPEYALNPHQVGARAAMGRQFKRIEWRLA